MIPMSIDFVQAFGGGKVKLGSRITLEREITLKFALIIICATVICVIGIGMVIGNAFFWNTVGTTSGVDRDFERVKQILKANPGDPNAHIALGMQLLMRKKEKEAITEFEKAYTLDKNSQATRFSLGFAYRQVGLYDKAINVLKPLVDEFPFYFNAQYNLGVAYQKTKLYNNAIIAYKSALRVNPGAADVYLDMAKTYAEMGKIKDAKENVDMALKYVPSYSEALSLKTQLNSK